MQTFLACTCAVRGPFSIEKALVTFCRRLSGSKHAMIQRRRGARKLMYDDHSNNAMPQHVISLASHFASQLSLAAFEAWRYPLFHLISLIYSTLLSAFPMSTSSSSPPRLPVSKSLSSLAQRRSQDTPAETVSVSLVRMER